MMSTQESTSKQPRLDGKRIAVLAARGVEQVELVEPRRAVEQAGGTTTLLSVESSIDDSGRIQAVNQDINPGDSFRVDAMVSVSSVDDYDGLLLPGGAVNPDNLRQDRHAVEFVRAFVTSGKPVGVICHGPWTLAEADVVRGRTLASFPSLRTDLQNAGATVVDEAVVTDDRLVSSRGPDDLPAFCAKVVEEFAKGPRPA